MSTWSKIWNVEYFSSTLLNPHHEKLKQLERKKGQGWYEQCVPNRVGIFRCVKTEIETTLVNDVFMWSHCCSLDLFPQRYHQSI